MQRNVSRAASALCLSMLLVAQGEYPALAASPQDKLHNFHPDQARRRDLSGRTSRSIIISAPIRMPRIRGRAGLPRRRRIRQPNRHGRACRSADQQPELLNPANGAGAANPFRLDRTQAATADQNHAYTPEAAGLRTTARPTCSRCTPVRHAGGAGAFGTTGQVMGYYDGNTVTALWNYAQHFAMSDNAYTDASVRRRRARSTWSPARPTACSSCSTADRQRPATTLPTAGRLHADQRRRSRPATSAPARPSDVVDGRQEHRRPAQRGRTSPGAASWAASTCRPIERQRHDRLHAQRPCRPSPVATRPTTFRITPGSSTTRRRRTRRTPVRARSQRSAIPIRRQQTADAGQPPVRHQRLLSPR